MTAKIVFSEVQKSNICRKYLIDKKTILDIAREHCVSETPIKRIFKELNIEARKPNETSRKYLLNENYFDIIDSFDKAYFLGLLMADGYNNEKRGAVTLILKEDDRLILERFSSYLDTEKPVIRVKNKDGSYTCRMEICSRNISEKLSKLGCGQAKTFKLKFPDYLNKDLVRHFIRGYFDGDGCISYCFPKRNNRFHNSLNCVVTFTSTDVFCSFLVDYIKDVLNINSYLFCRHPKHNNNNRTLQISGNKKVEKIMEWMYVDTDLYLERKYNKFKEFRELLGERRAIVSGQRSKNGSKVMQQINRGRICR